MDSTQYLTALVEFNENIRSGVYAPEWAPDLGHGSGQPLFTFLPPGLYWIAQIFHGIGFELSSALNATLIFGVFLSALAMWIWCHAWLGAWGALCAAIAYIFAPYFHTNLYVRGAYGEFMAFSVFPLVLWGLDRVLLGTDSAFSRIILGLSFCMVFLFHNPMTVVFTPFVVIYILTFLISRHTSLQQVLKAALFLGLGAGIASFFWIPALQMKSLVSVNRLLHGYLNYQNHLVYLEQLFYSRWGFDVLMPGLQDGMSQKVGELHILAFIAVLAFLGIQSISHKQSFRVLLAERKSAAWAASLCAGTVYACFFASNYSKFIWDRIELLQYLQFGMRFLTVGTLTSAALIGVVVHIVCRPGCSSVFDAGKILAACVFSAVLLFLNYPHAHPPKKYAYGVSDHSPYKIAAGGFTANTKDEFKPKGIWVAPNFSHSGISVVGGEAIISDIRREALCSSASVEVQNESAVVRLSRSCFPGWEVRLNDIPAGYSCENPYGQIDVNIPRGKVKVQACFMGTPLRRQMYPISFACAVLLLFGAIFLRGSNTRVHPEMQLPDVL